jgi:hypothetical protein
VLERVLGQLPGTCPIGEVVHLWQRGVLDDDVCGCGSRFAQCRFWQDIGERAFGGWSAALARRMVDLQQRVDRTRHVPALALGLHRGTRRHELAEYVSTFIRLYQAISQATGGLVLIDSSKHSSLAFCLRTDHRVDLRVVHVVRDSRGVGYSWTKEVRRPESADGAALMTRYSPARSALLWNGHNACFSALGRLGTPTYLLRYEDFVDDPGGTTAALARFADVPLPPGALDFIAGSSVRLSSSHTVAGNPMRFRSGDVVLRRDDDWRSRLPRADRRSITALTGPLLFRYGYLGHQR